MSDNFKRESYKRVMFVSPVACEPSFSGNSRRVSQLVTLFESLGVQVVFTLVSIDMINDRLEDASLMGNRFSESFFFLNNGNKCQKSLLQRGWEYIKNFIPWRFTNSLLTDFMFKDGQLSHSVCKEFEKVVEKVDPDVIVVEYAILSSLIKNLSPDILTILDTHDKFSYRNQRIRKSGGKGDWVSLTKSQEAALLNRFDTIFSIQEAESEYFKKIVNDQDKIHTVSIVEQACRDTFIENNNKLVIGFVGSNNSHNKEGLEVFLNSHWLALKKNFPEIELHIAGHKYAGFESWGALGVKFLGRIEDLGDFYDACSIIINPCMTGSGLKIKSVEALSYGKPLVTTPEGAEGLNKALENGMYCSKLDTVEFCLSCEELLQDKTLRYNDGLLAIEFIRNEYLASLSIIKKTIG